jgi:hypothetical protein
LKEMLYYQLGKTWTKRLENRFFQLLFDIFSDKWVSKIWENKFWMN